MIKKELVAAVENAKAETKIVLQTVYDGHESWTAEENREGRSRKSTVRPLWSGVHRMTGTIAKEDFM